VQPAYNSPQRYPEVDTSPKALMAVVVEATQQLRAIDPSQLKGLDRYERTQKVGEGTYGIVYKATDKVSNESVALKRIRFDSENDEGVPSTALREIAILREMRHPNVVGLRDVMFFGEKKKLYMVFDFHQYDLKRHMDVVGPIPTETVKSMLQQLVTGIGFLPCTTDLASGSETPELAGRLDRWQCYS